MGLLKFLIITICILWLIKMIVRLALPMLFQSLVNKAQQQANQQFRQQHQQQNRRPEGRIQVDYVPPREKDRGKSGGEFIEYEEIK
ncbi:MAG TPA: DUF4834 family protein [Sphingobacteriaceae bacterium]